MASGNNFGGGQPRQMQPYGGQQPRNMLGDRMQTDNRAAQAQQRRNQSFAQAQSPFQQFTAGAQYIGAANGAQLGRPDLGQGTLFDYGNGQYKFGTGPNDLRDIAGNWTFLRS